MKEIGPEIYEWMEKLWPLARSIVGPDYDQSLFFIKSLIGDLGRIIEFPTGQEVDGWKIPKAWKLNRGTIKDFSGKILVDSDLNNLHVWSHSQAFHGLLLKSQLAAHIKTLPDQPNAIPYTTTYYEQDWGFSLPHSLWEDMEDANYQVDIDTNHFDGSLKILEVFFEGESTSEILFSSYLCHPSMANNELSGPLVMAALIRSLSDKKLKYSYRFLIGPETIGAKCYLNMNADKLNERVIAAFEMTCLGGKNEWSYLKSITGNSLPDKIALNLLEHGVASYKTFPFSERGSDERQYSYPKVNLPMVSIMRSKYHNYPEYHTSLDNLDFVSEVNLQESFDFYQNLISLLEIEGNYLAPGLGEPFLSQMFDYPTQGARQIFRERQPYNLALDFLVHSRNSSFIDIANLLGISGLGLLPIVEKCLANRLVIRTPHIARNGL